MTFTFENPVLLIGGGPVGRMSVLAAQRFTDRAVAADGGANKAARYGVTLSAMIGDLDSVSQKALARYPGRYHHDQDQDTTDFEKCLKTVQAPLIIGVGFLGGRLDHELAALNALAKHPAQPVILLDAQTLVFRCPDRLALDLPAGTVFSLFPMGAVLGVASCGLKYPLEGIEMATGGLIGTSNLTISDAQMLSVTRGALLVIVPVRFLENVVRALLG